MTTAVIAVTILGGSYRHFVALKKGKNSAVGFVAVAYVTVAFFWLPYWLSIMYFFARLGGIDCVECSIIKQRRLITGLHL